LNDTIQKVEVESNDILVPPALTFCIENDLTCNFTVTVHNSRVGTGNDYITMFAPENLTEFLKLDPDINRVIHFSRTKNININNKVTNDVKCSIIDEFHEPRSDVNSSTNITTVMLLP
ncbi:11037_t:CDS:2, partial [Entrophospora sp. SA101]